MTDKTSEHVSADDRIAGEEAAQGVKQGWSKPEIVDYRPVTVARGVAYRIGDGISNLS